MIRPVTTTNKRTEVNRRSGWSAWLGPFFTSDIGMKWMMALTGAGLLAYVLAHMIGNLKIFLGADEINAYADALRELLHPLLPNQSVLWLLRIGLIAVFVIHIWAALILTRRNARARGDIRYHASREYVAANYASRTMRWTGIIILLFVLFHLADLTFGNANPDFVSGDVYHNVVASFERTWVVVIYVVAQIALAFHIYHGAWSMFQSVGLANPRYNDWRRWFAAAFALVILVGNVSMPLAVQFGLVG